MTYTPTLKNGQVVKFDLKGVSPAEFLDIEGIVESLDGKTATIIDFETYFGADFSEEVIRKFAELGYSMEDSQSFINFCIKNHNLTEYYSIRFCDGDNTIDLHAISGYHLTVIE